jgi:hypothetical protein
MRIALRPACSKTGAKPCRAANLVDFAHVGLGSTRMDVVQTRAPGVNLLHGACLGRAHLPVEAA